MSDDEILLASVMCDHVDVFEEVVKKFDPKAIALWCDQHGQTLLHLAVGSPFCLARLLDMNLNPNARDRIGRLTPLFLACLKQDVVCAQILLETADIDVNKTCGIDSETALHVVADQGNAELTRLVMERGGDPTQTDVHGECAFDRAANLEIFKLLLKGGFSTAGLIYGCERCEISLVAAAIEAGAFVNVVESGKSVLEIVSANSSCSKEMIELLIQSGAQFEPRAISAARQSGAKSAEFALKEHLGKKRKSAQKPFDWIAQHLRKTLSEEEISLVPRKWHLIGDVLLLQAVNPLLLELGTEKLGAVGEAFLSCPLLRVASVLLEKSSPSGELRTPQMAVLGGRASTETLHAEDGVRFWIDPALLMFSSGNGTERMHFKHAPVLAHENELVLDMFAGIGYFSIPLSLSTAKFRPRKIVCLEKNPISASFLRRNVVENKVQNVIEVLEGDNREQGNQYLGKVSRVIMGYIPTPEGFLARAISFLDAESGGVIHYHFVSRKDDRMTLPREHFAKHLSASWQIDSLNVRIVKDYAPSSFHCVADVELRPKK